MNLMWYFLTIVKLCLIAFLFYRFIKKAWKQSMNKNPKHKKEWKTGTGHNANLLNMKKATIEMHPSRLSVNHILTFPFLLCQHYQRFWSDSHCSPHGTNSWWKNSFDSQTLSFRVTTVFALVRFFIQDTQGHCWQNLTYESRIKLVLTADCVFSSDW